MTDPVATAVEAGSLAGFEADDPQVLQTTNNVVVWLRPHEVIAKVGTHALSTGWLTNEHRVASAIAGRAPTAEPIGHRQEIDGTTVTLWRRLAPSGGDAAPGTLGSTLADVHAAMRDARIDLPPLNDELEHARRRLADDERMAALPPADLTFLREAFDDLRTEVRRRDPAPTALHGEPHESNRIVTTDGVRWIDLEGACLGPLEWDLSFLPDVELGAFEHVDRELRAVLRALDAARRATWAWSMAAIPEMRALAEQQLDAVRAWRR